MNDYERFTKFQEKQYGVLTASDSARILDVHRATVYRWAKSGHVAYVIHHGRWYFGRDSLKRYAEILRLKRTWSVARSSVGMLPVDTDERGTSLDSMDYFECRKVRTPLDIVDGQ